MWILVTSGRGPNECQIAVKEIALRIYDRANASLLNATILDVQMTEYGWLSALIAIDNDSEEFAKEWEGTIQWTCPSPIRANWKRKNWFVSVRTIKYEPLEYSFTNKDLKFDTFRASGPGGQHVNKTDSAIRVTHIPTGMVAEAQEERSQYRNKSLAVARLSEMLKQKVDDSKKAAIHETWRKHDELERGNPVKVFKGPNFVQS